MSLQDSWLVVGLLVAVGVWGDWRRGTYGGAWLQQYLWIRESYTPQEEVGGLRAMTERMLVCQPGDAERLARGKPPAEAIVLKRGILEYLPSPYATARSRRCERSATARGPPRPTTRRKPFLSIPIVLCRKALSSTDGSCW